MNNRFVENKIILHLCNNCWQIVLQISTYDFKNKYKVLYIPIKFLETNNSPEIFKIKIYYISYK